MYKIQVRVGKHIGKRCTPESPGGVLTEEKVFEDRVYNEGDVFDSLVDLSLRDPVKFARLHDDGPRQDQPIQQAPKKPAASLPQPPADKPLDKMTVPELMAVVEAEEIETGGRVNDRNQLIALIKKSRGEK
jgi:hypothetical protein